MAENESSTEETLSDSESESSGEESSLCTCAQKTCASCTMNWGKFCYCCHQLFMLRVLEQPTTALDTWGLCSACAHKKRENEPLPTPNEETLNAAMKRLLKTVPHVTSLNMDLEMRFPFTVHR